jgi:hypothetical protein
LINDPTANPAELDGGENEESIVVLFIDLAWICGFRISG